MEIINSYYNKVEQFFVNNPNYGWLVLTVVFLPLGIGALLGKNWAINLSSSRQRSIFFIFGERIGRILTGIIFLLAAVLGAYMFYYTEYKMGM